MPQAELREYNPLVACNHPQISDRLDRKETYKLQDTDNIILRFHHSDHQRRIEFGPSPGHGYKCHVRMSIATSKFVSARQPH